MAWHVIRGLLWYFVASVCAIGAVTTWQLPDGAPLVELVMVRAASVVLVVASSLALLTAATDG